MSALTLGFIPLTDCAPVVVAAVRGFFADEGLAVTLSREASWATVRDKLAVGALDGAHLLAPMALAATAGGGQSPAIIAPLALGVNSAAITLSDRLFRALGDDAASPVTAAAGIAHLVAEGAAAGRPPMAFAVVFPHSVHNYMLRYWLAGAGIDPDRDVRLAVVAPPRMAQQLQSEVVDGICVSAPWNTVAALAGVGRIVLQSSRFWPGGPDKVLGVTEDFAGRDPARLQAILRALVRAQAWADEPANREELVALLAAPEHVDAAPEAVAAALGEDLAFHRGAAALPRPEHALWLLAQMARWKHLPAATDAAAVAARTYRPDLALEALAAAGFASEPAQPVGPLFDGKAFDA